MKKPLSPRQQQVYNLILSAHQQRRPSPTYREIGDALGISSTNGVADHVEACIKKGWLTTGGKGQSRSLRPVLQKPGGFVGRIRMLEEQLVEAQNEARAADLHRELNRRVAGAIGLLETRKDPETGLDYLPSWHDMPEQINAAKAALFKASDGPESSAEIAATWPLSEVVIETVAYIELGDQRLRELRDERDRLKDLVQAERDEVGRLRTMLSVSEAKVEAMTPFRAALDFVHARAQAWGLSPDASPVEVAAWFGAQLDLERAENARLRSEVDAPTDTSGVLTPTQDREVATLIEDEPSDSRTYQMACLVRQCLRANRSMRRQVDLLVEERESLTPRWRDGEPPCPPAGVGVWVWREDSHGVISAVEIIAQGRNREVCGYIDTFGNWRRWGPARWYPINPPVEPTSE